MVVGQCIPFSAITQNMPDKILFCSGWHITPFHKISVHTLYPDTADTIPFLLPLTTPRSLS